MLNVTHKAPFQLIRMFGMILLACDPLLAGLPNGSKWPRAAGVHITPCSERDSNLSGTGSTDVILSISKPSGGGSGWDSHDREQSVCPLRVTIRPRVCLLDEIWALISTGYMAKHASSFGLQHWQRRPLHQQSWRIEHVIGVCVMLVCLYFQPAPRPSHRPFCDA